MYTFLADHPANWSRDVKYTSLVICFILGIASTLFTLSVVAPKPHTTVVCSPTMPAAPIQQLLSLSSLVEMPDTQLAQQDVALVNLMCASGLPGAENINIPELRKTLDSWAALVKTETDRHFYKFRHKPDEYNNSEPYFRMLMLGSVLQQDLGVQYNRERIQDIDFKRSQDLFIHGMLGQGQGGTCVSMPVITAAVARRLGYPVRIVRAKAHLFCRWDDGTTRLNIEATSDGVNSFDDDYYKAWPHEISAEEVAAGLYLKNLTPREELAAFLAARGHCLEDNDRFGEAVLAYSHANQLAPSSREYQIFLQGLVMKQVPLSLAQQHSVTEQFLEQHPQMFAVHPQQRRPQQGRSAMYPPGYQQQQVIDPWGQQIPQNKIAFDPMFP